MKKYNKVNLISVVVIIVILVLTYVFSPAFRAILADYGFTDIFKKPIDCDLNGNTLIHVIDVGQGDAILLQNKTTNVLIDAGPNSSQESLVSYLKSQDVKTLDLLVLTHPHEDHLGGADKIIDAFEIDTLIMPDVTSTDKFFENTLDAIEKHDVITLIPKRGDKFTLDDLDFTVLAPGDGEYKETNDYSIVLKVTYKDTSFMFTGDCEAVSENEMLESFDADFLKCDFLKAAHHGSSTSNTREFVSTLSPSLAAISCGYENSYGHPHREVRTLFDELGIEYTRTDLDGTAVYVSNGNKISRK